MHKISTLGILFIMLFTNSIYSQITKDIPNYFPVSPNAASFAKQGLFPVDYSTGKINISIPLYTIKTNELTVPIDINYNSAGIQLDELASWVGLGWNLSAGGAVIRNVKGIPDTGQGVPNIANLAFTDANYRILYNQFNPYNSRTVDTAYDEFIVNAPGLSGTFYFVDNKAVFRDLQNTVVKTSLSNNQLFTNTQTLEITKDDGTIYRFGQGLDDYNATEIARNTSDVFKPEYVSTWYLTEIIPANSKSPKDIVSFKYKAVDYTSDYDIAIGETLVDNAISNNNPPKLRAVFPGRTSTNRQFLTAINFSNGTIEFTSSKNRQDLADDYKLDKISIYNVLGTSKKLIQDYSFVYDYYSRHGGSITTDYYPSNYNDIRNVNSRNKSLKLTQIINNTLNVGHTFEYEATQLPLRGTTQKDYWGYINTNTGDLSPQTRLNRKSEMAPQNVTFLVGNGNRTANENMMKSGVLQKITYPEGGYSIFEYEANRYTENVTTPTIVNKSESATAYGYGIGCTIHTATNTFTPVNYVSGSGKITISFMQATDENGGATNATYDSEKFVRPLPFTIGGNFFYTRDFGNLTHTLSAQEFRTGSFGAQTCPITTITASWQEVSQTTTAPTVKLIGGLRIKSIKNYDGVNSNPVSTRQYNYENENVLVREGNGSYVRGIFAEDRKSDVLPVFSTTAVFDNNTGGSPSITYGKITELDIAIDGKKNGKTEYFYENIPLSRIFDIKNGNLPTIFKSPSFNIYISYNINQPMEYLTDFAFFKNELWNQGSLLEKRTYKIGDLPNTFKIINSVVNTYSILKQSTLPYNIIFNNYPSLVVYPGEELSSFYLPYKQQADFHSGLFYYAVGQTSLGKKVMSTTTERDYDNNEKETNKKITTYAYENPVHYQVTKTETSNSKNDALRTQLSYPQDLLTTGQTAEMQKLVVQNKIDKPIKTETFVNNIQTSESITKFEEGTATGNLLLPKEIHSTKGTVETFPFNDANRKITFNLYDTDIVNGGTVGNGNVLQYSIENGTPVCIIWGYNKSQPIAKIENSTYTNIPTDLITAAQNASDTGTENNLITALDNLRTALPTTMVTTYTYIPLVGVSTITDPKGYKMIYTYDAANRLQFVKDAQGRLLSENQYRYKNQ